MRAKRSPSVPQSSALDTEALPAPKTKVAIKVVSQPATERPDPELGPLGHHLGYALRRAQIAVFQLFFDAFAECDIRVGQYSVLTVIEQNPGLSQTQVAASLGIKKTNFVAVIDQLETRGLVRRATTPGDRRTYALFLTGDGRTLMKKLHKIAEAQEQRLITRVGEADYQRLFRPLWAIASLADKANDDETE